MTLMKIVHTHAGNPLACKCDLPAPVSPLPAQEENVVVSLFPERCPHCNREKHFRLVAHQWDRTRSTQRFPFPPGGLNRGRKKKAVFSDSDLCTATRDDVRQILLVEQQVLRDIYEPDPEPPTPTIGPSPDAPPAPIYPAGARVKLKETTP